MGRDFVKYRLLGSLKLRTRQRLGFAGDICSKQLEVVPPNPFRQRLVVLDNNRKGLQLCELRFFCARAGTNFGFVLSLSDTEAMYTLSVPSGY
jgi:hypothetical protein